MATEVAQKLSQSKARPNVELHVRRTKLNDLRFMISSTFDSAEFIRLSINRIKRVGQFKFELDPEVEPFGSTQI